MQNITSCNLLKIIKFLSAACHFLSILFIIITVCITFIPFSPKMPAAGLDGDWWFSLNEALARGLVIGRDIVFTLGPYASVYTRAYHPATDGLMMAGCIYLAACMATMLLLMYLRGGRLVILVFVVAMLLFSGCPDALLFAYLAWLAVFTVSVITTHNGSQTWSYASLPLVIILPFMTVLGFLPLVKGSLLPICIVGTGLIGLLLLVCKQYLTAVAALLLPIFSCLIFWKLSGQEFSDFLGYFTGLAPIISGYGEAMSLEGNPYEIIGYLISAGAAGLVIATCRPLPALFRLFLMLLNLFLFFNLFKAGFIRHDGHAQIAAICMVLAMLALRWLTSSVPINVALGISLISFAFVARHNGSLTDKNQANNFKQSYAISWLALQERLSNKKPFLQEYQARMETFRLQTPLPHLPGSSDIYSFGQTSLLASGNIWNPRPIFQSYSAYTPSLARLNEQHLRGYGAPDNIFFRIEPLDKKHPMLEDGLSWLALFDNYSLAALEGSLAILRKNRSCFHLVDSICL